VKDLRLAGISSIEAANAWLSGFIAAHNARFGREPANAKDLQRKLSAADNLDEILAWREEGDAEPHPALRPDAADLSDSTRHFNPGCDVEGTESLPAGCG
jgi:hypothetical protein